MGSNVLPTARDVEEAYLRLRGWLNETPVLESEQLNDRTGSRVWVKAESVQHAGSFKIRGALNRLLQLSELERRAGVVAFSSGNHAQAVALAAKWLGVRATIVMPREAPRVKRLATERWGANVVLYDRDRQDRESLAAGIAEKYGASIVPPFDHPDVIAGQGTVGLELARSARSRGIELEAVYVPCGGGGLIAGCGLAVKSVFPQCSMVAVEPEAYDDTRRSLRAGQRRTAGGHGASICDGLMAPTPGAITFAINRSLISEVVTVSDAAVRHATAFAARHLKLVLEPSGAAALAAVLSGGKPGRRRIGVVLSGGNVDASLFASILRAFPDP